MLELELNTMPEDNGSNIINRVSLNKAMSRMEVPDRYQSTLYWNAPVKNPAKHFAAVPVTDLLTALECSDVNTFMSSGDKLWQLCQLARATGRLMFKGRLIITMSGGWNSAHGQGKYIITRDVVVPVPRSAGILSSYLAQAVPA